MQKSELIRYLNEYLKIKDFTDGSKNGLQVDNSRNEVKKIAFSVDASTYIFDKAIKQNVDLIFVHHGLFWGFEPVVVGLHYERVSRLIKNGSSPDKVLNFTKFS